MFEDILVFSLGAMTVESLEAEHRKSLSPRGQDSENLGDLSSKLKEQLGVKMTTTVQVIKSNTVALT